MKTTRGEGCRALPLVIIAQCVRSPPQATHLILQIGHLPLQRPQSRLVAHQQQAADVRRVAGMIATTHAIAERLTLIARA